jgi:hypothetical protein
VDNNLKASGQRAVQYWFKDGLAELSGGVICLVLAVYFGLQQILQSSQGSFAIFFLLVFVAAFGIRKVMLWYRERSTYPRTGFVRAKSGLENHWLLGVSIIFTLLLMAFMLYTIIRGIQTVVWIPVLCGFIYTFIFALVGYQTKLGRFYFLGAFCLLLGLVLALSGLGDFWGAAVLSLVTSLILFAFGIITRRAYIHQTMTITENADER